MTNDDYENFSALWLATAELYPGRGPTDQAVELAFAALSGYALEDVRRALSDHVRDPDVGQYQPKPADIVRRIDGAGTDRAYAAWNQAVTAAARVGQYRSTVFDDPLIHCIIEDMGGWPGFCRTHEDDLPFVRQDFMKRYAAYERRRPETWPAQLVGVEDHENRAHGFPDAIQPPTLIGNQHRAAQVHHEGRRGRTLQLGTLDAAVDQALSHDGDTEQ